MSDNAAIYTYLSLDPKTDPRVMPIAAFLAKYPAVRAPEWCMTKAEKAALEPRQPVMQGKKGKAA